MPSRTGRIPLFSINQVVILHTGEIGRIKNIVISKSGRDVLYKIKIEGTYTRIHINEIKIVSTYGKNQE